MILPLLFVPLVYGISSTPDACALYPDPKFGNDAECQYYPHTGMKACCWKEPDILNPGETIEWCQSCKCLLGLNSQCHSCSRPEAVRGSSSTGPLVLPDEGVVDVMPTPTPSPFRPPTGGIFDQPSPPSPTLPPTLPQEDGQNVDEGSGPLNPQGGGILQQPEEVEDPEDEGENEEEDGSSGGDQGAETAGPLT